MSVYLSDIPLDDAIARFNQALKKVGSFGICGVEDVTLNEHIVGRILALPVWAKISSPHYHASAMDGFAILSVNTSDAKFNDPVSLDCEIKGIPDALYVDTGDPLPPWADAVIPIEYVEPLDAEGNPATDPRKPVKVRIRSSVTPWQHVRPMGEDMVASQLVLPAGHRLRPVDLGALAASGNASVTVARQPRVAIVPTGSELVPVGTSVKAGDIIEYNSIVLAGQINQWGGIATRLEITKDRFSDIQQRVAEAAVSHDLVLINAGSSAGSEDFTAAVVESLGELLFHGVAVRPGHPVIVGMIELAKASQMVPEIAGLDFVDSENSKNKRHVPVIGVPGYPVSAALTGEIFVEPLIARWLGRERNQPTTVSAKLTRKVTSPAGDDDYMRVAVGKVGDQLLAAPLSRGSGVISSLVRADGIVIIPRGSQGLPAGANVNVNLYIDRGDLTKTIFAIGSHDMVLDLLAHHLSKRERRFASANVGSIGGLVALRRGEAHLAGAHLLDPETGEYNKSYIREYLPGIPVIALTFVDRQQGLMVQKANPKAITKLEDLMDSGVKFINRQKGSGTRVLLDYHLDRYGITKDNIIGYTHEEFTHLTVAAAIASGRVDCGLGIAAAANALDLDFIPLYNESYQLVIPKAFYEDELLRPLLDILVDENFQKEVGSIPGYDAQGMGEVIFEKES